MREDTVLVSIMMVNNEIGAVEPVEEAAKVIKAKNPDTLFHVDAIQAYGKFRICPKKSLFICCHTLPLSSCFSLTIRLSMFVPV